MTNSDVTTRKKSHSTALCNACGETCSRHTSAVKGDGWDCLWCGYLNNSEVNSISNVKNPTYSDGSAVKFPE